jgi:hypothetical protein
MKKGREEASLCDAVAAGGGLAGADSLAAVGALAIDDISALAGFHPSPKPLFSDFLDLAVLAGVMHRGSPSSGPMPVRGPVQLADQGSILIDTVW